MSISHGNLRIVPACCELRYEHRHLALLQIGAETLITKLFMGTREPRAVVPGNVVPLGARVHRDFWHDLRDALCLVVEHPSLPAVSPGEEAPALNGYACLVDMVYPLPTEPGVYS